MLVAAIAFKSILQDPPTKKGLDPLFEEKAVDIFRVELTDP